MAARGSPSSSGSSRWPPAASVLLLAALLVAPWPGDRAPAGPQRHRRPPASRLAAAQGQASSADQLAASEAATATEFDSFEDALSLAAQTAGGQARGSRGGTGKASFTDADKLRNLQEGTYFIGGAPDAFPTCRFKNKQDGQTAFKGNSTFMPRRPDCNNFVPRPRDQRDCATCVTQAVATAMQMSVAATLQQPVEDWEVSYSSLYYCSKGGRSCQTGWDIQEALNFLVDNQPQLIQPSSCLRSVAELTNADLEPSISQWGPVCDKADAAMKDCPLASPSGLFLNCTYKSLGTFWEMQRHIRRHGAVITRVRIPSDFEQQFGKNASQYGGEELRSYRFNDTARGLYGHAVVIVGYNNTERTWTVLNSWGDKTTRPGRFGVTADGLYRIQMGLLAIGTPDLTYGVQCVPLPGSPADLHQAQPWERAAAKPMELVNPKDAQNLDAPCYTYRFNSSVDTVSSVVDHFGLNMTTFVRDNKRLFPDQNVTYSFVGRLLQDELQLVLDTAQRALNGSSARPYARCTFYGPPGNETEISLNCTASAADCMEGVFKGNGTTGCELVYSAANVSEVLPGGTPLNICGIPAAPGFDRVAHFDDVRVSQRRALLAILRALGDEAEVPEDHCKLASYWILDVACDVDKDWVESLYIIDPQINDPRKTRLVLMGGGLLRPLLRLERLRNLTLSFLDGPLPPQLGALGRMKDINISYHCAWGELPANWLGGWEGIESLAVGPWRNRGAPVQFAGQACGVTGSMPKRWTSTSVGNRLQELDLHDNQLAGELPQLANMPSLFNLDLSGNRLQGWLPRRWPSTFNSIRSIDLSGNADLTGLVPREWASLGSLTSLQIANTSLESCLPSEFRDRTTTTYGGTKITGYCSKTVEDREKVERAQAKAMRTTFGQLFADRGGGNAVSLMSQNYADFSAWYTNMFDWAIAEGLDAENNHRIDDAVGANVKVGRSWDKAEGVVYLTYIAVEGVLLDLTHLGDFVSKLPRLQNMDATYCAPGDSAGAGRLPSDLPRRAHPALTVLGIASSKIVGTLPDTWGRWSTLRELYLWGNSLQGTLPPSWGRMRSLETLWLPFNSLTGTLAASWGNMKSLQRLVLLSNLLTGTLPASWRDMRSLASGVGPNGAYSLDLYGNEGIIGTLPPEWGDSGSSMPDNITFRFAGGARLTGTIPPSFKRFGTISLKGTNIEGCIPPGVTATGLSLPSCGKGERQAVLALHDLLAAAYGSSPGLNSWLQPPDDDLAHCRNKTGIQCDADDRVVKVDLPALQLRVRPPAQLDTTELFDALSGLPALQSVASSRMRLVGPLPMLPWPLSDGIFSLDKLQAIDLKGNPEVTGGLPSSWQALQELQVLDVSGCSGISGTLPEEFVALQRLKVLRAADTGIAGQLPQMYGLLKNLEELDVSNARLSGPSVPVAWVDALQLRAAAAATGLASAPVLLAAQAAAAALAAAAAASAPSPAVEQPTAGSTQPSVLLTRLRVLRLANNQFSGTLEPGLSKLPALRVLDVSAAPGQGTIAGNLPLGWIFMAKVQELSLSGQKLSGGLPPQWSTLSTLKKLTLADNRLIGPLPSTWVSMSNLKALDLSRNSGLNGTVPSPWVQLGWCSKVLLSGTGVTGCPSSAGDLGR